MSVQIFTFVHTGIVAELDGKFYGIQYSDAHHAERGFGPIEKASIYNPERFNDPSEMTWKGSPMEESLSKSKLKFVTVTKTYEVAP